MLARLSREGFDAPRGSLAQRDENGGHNANPRGGSGSLNEADSKTWAIFVPSSNVLYGRPLVGAPHQAPAGAVHTAPLVGLMRARGARVRCARKLRANTKKSNKVRYFEHYGRPVYTSAKISTTGLGRTKSAAAGRQQRNVSAVCQAAGRASRGGGWGEGGWAEGRRASVRAVRG